MKLNSSTEIILVTSLMSLNMLNWAAVKREYLERAKKDLETILQRINTFLEGNPHG